MRTGYYGRYARCRNISVDTAIERIKNGEITMDTNVTVSNYASKVPYGITLVAGKQYTVRDLLKATIIRSSNNAAEALGEFNGNGDVSIFVNKMNQKANELGLTTLRYCTPHGLPPEDTQGRRSFRRRGRATRRRARYPAATARWRPRNSRAGRTATPPAA